MGLDMYLIAYKNGYEEEEIYWRKSNEIFKFFDDRINDGVSNCVQYRIDRETLEELLMLCKQVLRTNELAEKLLPTTEGCFFGSTEYDELYFRDVERTAKELEEILKLNAVFVFHAWW